MRNTRTTKAIILNLHTHDTGTHQESEEKSQNRKRNGLFAATLPVTTQHVSKFNARAFINIFRYCSW